MSSPLFRYRGYILIFCGSLFFLVEKYGVLEQSDITDTEHFIAEDQLWAFLKASQPDTLQKLEDDYGTDAREWRRPGVAVGDQKRDNAVIAANQVELGNLGDPRCHRCRVH